MTKIISYSDLARQHHLNFLDHKRREYQEREEYLARARRLLFKIEGQLRQAEILQFELIAEIARHFRVPLEFPSLGDRVEMQKIFSEHPFLVALSKFLEGRLTPLEFFARLEKLKEKGSTPPAEKD